MTARGFTNRDFADRHPNAPRDSAGDEILTLAVNLIEDRQKAVLVSSMADGLVVTAWLAKKLIEIEPFMGLGVHGTTVRIRVPRWLAEEKGLAAKAGPGQMRLDLGTAGPEGQSGKKTGELF